MPRYRFAWTNLPPKQLVALAASLGIKDDPADGLRRRFGARPKPAFVQDAWPALLAVWLPADSLSRRAIVGQLRDKGLGKMQIATRTKQGELDYLRSCRNSPTLREIVVTAFLSAGETPRLEAPTERLTATATPSPTTSTPQRKSDSDVVETGRALEAPASGEGSADLNDWIDATLKEAYGLSEVQRDEDGDIPLPRGSAVVFIRPHDGDSPFLEIYSPLLTQFRMSPEVYEAVNEINLQVTIGKAIVVSDGALIVLSAHLLAHGMSKDAFIFAIDVVSAAADHFDTLLQKRFGGSTLLEDEDADALDV